MALYVNIPPTAYVDPWVSTNVGLLKAIVPQLTGFGYIKAGIIPVSQAVGAVVGDASVEGGGIQGTRVFGASIFQTPKTGKWGMVFRAKLAAPTAGRVAKVGLVNAAGSHALDMGTDNAVSATNFVGRILGGAQTDVVTTVAANTTVNDYGITCNGTTLSLFVNGALAGSTTTLTNLSDEPLLPFMSATVASDAFVYQLLYGYIAP